MVTLQTLKRSGWEMVIVYKGHAIFAREYKDGHFHCVNSYGENDPEPRVSKEAASKTPQAQSKRKANGNK